MTQRILVIDIETSPALGWFYGATYKANIISVHQASRMLCFAAKWRGERAVQFASVHQDGREGMLKQAAALLDEADAIITYNGARFDSPWMRTEFLIEGIPQPSPYREIDLYKVSKGKLQFHQNRLNYVAQQLGLGMKVQHNGLPLWLACMDGDDRAWAKFARYNKQDVLLTEKLYDAYLPVIPQSLHPNLSVNGSCPKCGRDALQKRGFSRTTVSTFQRYQCQRCGTWTHDGKRVEAITQRGAS